MKFIVVLWALIFHSSFFVLILTKTLVLKIDFITNLHFFLFLDYWLALYNYLKDLKEMESRLNTRPKGKRTHNSLNNLERFSLQAAGDHFVSKQFLRQVKISSKLIKSIVFKRLYFLVFKIIKCLIQVLRVGYSIQKEVVIDKGLSYKLKLWYFLRDLCAIWFVWHSIYHSKC